MNLNIASTLFTQRFRTSDTPVAVVKPTFDTDVMLSQLDNDLSRAIESAKAGNPDVAKTAIEGIARQAHNFEFNGNKEVANQIDVLLKEAALELEVDAIDLKLDDVALWDTYIDTAKVIYSAINSVSDELVKNMEDHSLSRDVEASTRLEALSLLPRNSRIIGYDSFVPSKPGIEYMKGAADDDGRKVAQYCFGLKCHKSGDYKSAAWYYAQSSNNGFSRATDAWNELTHGRVFPQE